MHWGRRRGDNDSACRVGCAGNSLGAAGKMIAVASLVLELLSGGVERESLPELKSALEVMQRRDDEAMPRQDPFQKRWHSHTGFNTNDPIVDVADVIPAVNLQLYKMGAFCCNVVASFVRGNPTFEHLSGKLQIDQRTKLEHCISHFKRAGDLVTVWNFSAAERGDCAAYDALCEYFLDKQRVGLVEAPSYYVYIVPPVEDHLKRLGLPLSNFVVGLQVATSRRKTSPRREAGCR